MNLTISAYNIDSHKLFMKPTMVMEKVDVSVETVNTKGNKVGTLETPPGGQTATSPLLPKPYRSLARDLFN